MDEAARAAQIDQILANLMSDVDVAACAWITDDGLLLAGAPDPEAEAAIGEPTTAWLAHSADIARGLGLGGLREITLRGPSGHGIVVRTGPRRFLVACTGPEATLALAVLNARHAALALSNLA